MNDDCVKEGVILFRPAATAILGQLVYVALLRSICLPPFESKRTSITKFIRSSFGHFFLSCRSTHVVCWVCR